MPRWNSPISAAQVEGDGLAAAHRDLDAAGLGQARGVGRVGAARRAAAASSPGRLGVSSALSGSDVAAAAPAPGRPSAGVQLRRRRSSSSSDWARSNQLARVVRVAVVQRAVAELARHLGRLGAIVAPLAVREPQHQHVARGVRALAQAAVDRGRAVEPIDRLVGPRRLDQRVARRLALAGAEALLRLGEQVLDLRSSARSRSGLAAAGRGAASARAEDRAARRRRGLRTRRRRSPDGAASAAASARARGRSGQRDAAARRGLPEGLRRWPERRRTSGSAIATAASAPSSSASGGGSTGSGSGSGSGAGRSVVRPAAPGSAAPARARARRLRVSLEARLGARPAFARPPRRRRVAGHHLRARRRQRSASCSCPARSYWRLASCSRRAAVLASSAQQHARFAELLERLEVRRARPRTPSRAPAAARSTAFCAHQQCSAYCM